MSSLDVLDYQVGLEAALARRGPDGRPLLEQGLRRQAIRDVRRTIDAMAFRFALMDERPLPEDLDYLRALETLKEPERAAPVLARRAPVYRRNRRRRLVTSWTILATLVLLAAGVVYAATLEKATTLAEVNERGEAGDAIERAFTVDANVTRLHLDGTIVVSRGMDGGPIVVSLIGPDGREYLGEGGRVGREFYPQDGNYLRDNVYSPVPGEWILRVIYGGAGSAYVTVDGITPNR